MPIRKYSVDTRTLRFHSRLGHEFIWLHYMPRTREIELTAVGAVGSLTNQTFRIPLGEFLAWLGVTLDDCATVLPGEAIS